MTQGQGGNGTTIPSCPHTHKICTVHSALPNTETADNCVYMQNKQCCRASYLPMANTLSLSLLQNKWTDGRMRTHKRTELERRHSLSGYGFGFCVDTRRVATRKKSAPRFQIDSVACKCTERKRVVCKNVNDLLAIVLSISLSVSLPCNVHILTKRGGASVICKTVNVQIHT